MGKQNKKDKTNKTSEYWIKGGDVDYINQLKMKQQKTLGNYNFHNINPFSNNIINTNEIKPIYGDPHSSRALFYQYYPEFTKSIDSIAHRYNISPSLLKTRLAREGVIDLFINVNNRKLNEKQPKYSRKDLLNSFYNSDITNGFGHFGLDDVGTLIKEGKVKLINEKYKTTENTNENNRKVLSADGLTTLDNIGIMAATLKHYKDEAKRYHPLDINNWDRIANIYYNRGVYGGNNYIKRKNKKNLGYHLTF